MGNCQVENNKEVQKEWKGIVLSRCSWDESSMQSSSQSPFIARGNEMAGLDVDHWIYISRNKYKGGLKMQVERNHNEGLWVTLRVGFSRRIVIDDWAIRSSWGLNHALSSSSSPLLIMIFHWRTIEWKWCESLTSMTIYEMDELKTIKFNLLRRRWWARADELEQKSFRLVLQYDWTSVHFLLAGFGWRDFWKVT